MFYAVLFIWDSMITKIVWGTFIRFSISYIWRVWMRSQPLTHSYFYFTMFCLDVKISKFIFHFLLFSHAFAIGWEMSDTSIVWFISQFLKRKFWITLLNFINFGSPNKNQILCNVPWNIPSCIHLFTWQFVIVTMKWDCLCGTAPLMGPLSNLQMIHEQQWKDIGRRKPKDSEKNLSLCQFVQNKSHMDCIESNPRPPRW